MHQVEAHSACVCVCYLRKVVYLLVPEWQQLLQNVSVHGQLMKVHGPKRSVIIVSLCYDKLKQLFSSLVLVYYIRM